MEIALESFLEVLTTGDKVEATGHIGSYHTVVALLPEGNDPRFLLTNGWLSLGLDRFSLSSLTYLG